MLIEAEKLQTTKPSVQSVNFEWGRWDYSRRKSNIVSEKEFKAATVQEDTQQRNSSNGNCLKCKMELAVMKLKDLKSGKEILKKFREQVGSHNTVYT